MRFGRVLRPRRGHARDWAMKARRYVLARRALDAIETAALLEPRVQPAAVRRRRANAAPL